MSDISRVTGMYSGFDTDTMVQDLLKVEQTKIDRVEQKKQVAQWQQEQYREISSLLSGLQSEYFDILNTDTNLRSSTMFDLYSASASISGTATTKVQVDAEYGVQVSQMTISEISQLATKDTWNSSSRVSNILGSTAIDAAQVGTINATIAGGTDAINVTVDGVTKSITLTGGYDTSTDADARTALQSDFQTQLDDAFGSGVLTVSYDGSNYLQIDSTGHEVTVNEKDADILTDLGLSDGMANTVDMTSTLADAFGVTDSDLSFTINGVTDFGLESTDTIQEMISKINTSGAGVTLYYSDLTGEFSMTSDTEGYANNIELTDTDSFFATHLLIDGSDRTEGQDAEFVLNGISTTRSSNSFTIDGVSFELLSTHDAADGDIDIDITTDVSDVVEKIEGFVDKYNEVIEFINDKLGEERDYDYSPLTDAQKDELTDDEIDDWEEIAKQGLLRSDSTLQNIVNSLRQAIYEPIEGLGITMSDIGITTSANYLDGGKLVVDTDVLTEALKNNPNEVVELFTKQSDTDYTDYTERSTRYEENGIANRINDLINDNIRLTRDDSGYKGTLVEKAGLSGIFDVSSELAKTILDYEDSITLLLEHMADKEDDYYVKFANMESVLSSLYSQSDWLASQF